MRDRAGFFAVTAALAAGLPAAELPSAHRLGTISISQAPVERITIRNLGRHAIPNPRVLPAEEAPDSTSVRTIAASVAEKGSGTDREKAETLWRFVMDRIRHICPSGADGVWLGYGPLETLNTLGFACCDQAAATLASLWLAAGLPARIAVFPFHTVPEVSYDDRWHMYDPDHRVAYLLRDNQTVASVDEILGDPSLVSRVPDPLGYDSRWMSQMYLEHRNSRSSRDVAPPSDPDPFLLQPGSTMTLDRRGDGIEPVPLGPSTVPYRWSRGILVDRIRISPDERRLSLRGARLRGPRATPMAAWSVGYIHVPVAAPTRIAGASLSLRTRISGSSRIVVRVAGEPESIGAPVSTLDGGASEHREIDLTHVVRSLATDRFWLVIELDARGEPDTVALVDEMAVTIQFQMSPWSLPTLEPGRAPVWYRDDRGGAGADVAVEIEGQILRYRGSPVADTPRPWEAVADAGVAAWRAYLADTSHRVEKRLELPSSPPPEPCRLRVFLDGANSADGRSHAYRMTAAIDGAELSDFPGIVPEEPGWYDIPLSAALLRGKSAVAVSLCVTGEPDTDWNYVSVYGGPPESLGLSKFQGDDFDLSLDPGTQRGEFLIRIFCGGG